jgi:hypothetical protein
VQCTLLSPLRAHCSAHSAQVSVGHCHPEVVAAINKQNETLQHMASIYLNHQASADPGLASLSVHADVSFCDAAPADSQISDYAEELAARMPGNLKVSLMCGGCACCVLSCQAECCDSLSNNILRSAFELSCRGCPGALPSEPRALVLVEILGHHIEQSPRRLGLSSHAHAGVLPYELTVMQVCYLVNSGSEANDMAILLARLYTGSFDVVALRNCYHGMSLGTMGVTAHSTWKYDVPQARGVHYLSEQCLWPVLDIRNYARFYSGPFLACGFVKIPHSAKLPAHQNTSQILIDFQ